MNSAFSKSVGRETAKVILEGKDFERPDGQGRDLAATQLSWLREHPQLDAFKRANDNVVRSDQHAAAAAAKAGGSA